MSEYTYNVLTQVTGGVVDLDVLEKTIAAKSYSADLSFINLFSTALKINFSTDLQASEITDLDSVVLNHTTDPLEPYKKIINNAVDFFQEIMTIYAAENITLGITYYNKTKIVSDFLVNVLRYGQTGSLYEVIHEIDALIAAGIPAELAPYVTDTRMTNFKQKILDYLA